MSEEKNTLDKKKVETIKLLLSSLFARKQKYLVVDGANKNKVIYSNFPYERTIYYRPTPEDTMCGVTINPEVMPIFHEAFPVLDNVVAEINLQPFMSTFNKGLSTDKTKWPEITVDKTNDKLYMCYKENDEVKKVEIGRLLPPDAHQYYESIMKKFMNFTKDISKVEFELPTDHLDDDVLVTDIVLPDENKTKITLPIQDGVSVVSFKEYLKKRGFPIKYEAQVQYRPDSKSAKVAFAYKDDLVDCLGMMPGTIWFPFFE